MRRSALLLSFCLALPVLGGVAGEPATILYVGKFQEVIELPSDWSVMVDARGPMEAAYFHRKYADDERRVPFTPKPDDYGVENFARLELMELLVIPKNARGGFQSLADIRAAKEAENGPPEADTKILDEKERGWPRGTFHVLTTRPFRFVQTYTESATEYFILTNGGRLEAGEFALDGKRAEAYNRAVERALQSLRAHVSRR